MKRSSLLTLVALLLTMGWLVHESNGLFSSPAKQRDFRTYQQSAELFQRGGNPYDADSIVRFAGDTSMFRYMYPPQTLPLFAALFSVPGTTSRAAFFGLQIAAIIFLLWLWTRYLVPHPSALPLLLLFFVFAFRSAASVDLTSGNLNVINGCLLWIGFVAFLRRRYALFSILIFLSAICKNVEILFLGLLLFERERKAYGWLGIMLGIFILQHLAGYILYPNLYRAWLVNLNTNYEWGALNPAALPAIDGAFFGLTRMLGIKNPWGYSAMAIYAAYAMMLPIVTIRLLKNVDREKNRLALLMLAVFGFAILLPRFKDYSYVLLLLPAAWLVVCKIPRTIWKILYIAAVCIPLFAYQPLVVAIGSFVYILIELRKDSHRASTTGVSLSVPFTRVSIQ